MEETPREACGVIVPNLDHPPDQWVIQLKNRSPFPETSYAIDPQTVQSLLKDPEGWADVIIWHTHPKGNVGPSGQDYDHRVKELNYMVVALPTGEAVRF